MPGEASGYVTLARILRPRGIKGEVSAEVLTDFPERLTKLREVFLTNHQGEVRRTLAKKIWLHQDRAIFHFEGCDSIEAAEKLRGLEVQLPLSHRVVLPKGQYFVTDLIGCEVFDSAPAGAGKALLGIVRDVQFTGEGVTGTPNLVVETPGGELLIPLAEEICTHIDVAARRVEVALPDGLRTLNQAK